MLSGKCWNHLKWRYADPDAHNLSALVMPRFITFFYITNFDHIKKPLNSRNVQRVLYWFLLFTKVWSFWLFFPLLAQCVAPIGWLSINRMMMMMFCPFEEWWSGNILLQMAMLHHSPDNRAKRFRCQSKFQPPRSASSICYLSLPNHIFLFCGLLLQGILKLILQVCLWLDKFCNLG